ncbi:MAG: DUF4843 domain-containing protein [Bacteroidaceae bacterium]|nr:DUF4843 domain-containing protein [Bacteroidaceae bacterium]
MYHLPMIFTMYHVPFTISPPRGGVRGGLSFLLISLALLIFSSCTKEEVSTYDTGYTALNIWVGNAAGAVFEKETYNYSYAYEEGSVTFYAQLSGMPVPYDRTFRLEAFGGDSALMANTVRVEDYVLPAGAIRGEYKVYFNSQKLSDPTLFTKQDGMIHFRMVPNDQFAIGSENHQQFTVVLKNYLAKPSNWDKANFPSRALSVFFGTYSRVKYQFMIEHLGMKDFEVNYNAQTAYNEETNVVSNSYAIYLLQVMQRALNEYNNTHETPLTDEQGNLVTFPNSAY